jgi:hypothetical protein
MRKVEADGTPNVPKVMLSMVTTVNDASTPTASAPSHRAMITPETRLPNAISSLAPSVQITFRENLAEPDSAVVDPVLIPKT